MIGPLGSNEPSLQADLAASALAKDAELLAAEEEHCSKDRSIIGPYSVEAPEPRD